MYFSKSTTSFRGRKLPEEGVITGYAAIIEAHDLAVPVPDQIVMVSAHHRKYSTPDVLVFPVSFLPDQNLYSHLIFALKNEGVNLLILKALFDQLPEQSVLEILDLEPAGKYSRTIWFLYEWLLAKQLNLPDADSKIRYTPLLNEKLQYSVTGAKSPRHRVINNLPGTPAFCPLIRKTKTLEAFIDTDLAEKARTQLGQFHRDILLRTSAFLLLKDSKASFAIEGESPKSMRMARWATAIGQAGSVPLSKEELLRLQQIIIENTRFFELGYRTKGGFVGEHDRETAQPIPDHISAKPEDIESLMKGVIDTSALLQRESFDPVLTSAMIAFGFVFIHPFVDGNGRIHRYLIHHILATKQFSIPGIIFPVSKAILDKMTEYKNVLESHSRPLLDFIDWRITEDHNVEVVNKTIDYYRYFDATRQAEFLFACVKETIDRIIPEEIQYLLRYDEFKQFAEDEFGMPDKTISLLVTFLQQNNGTLSQRARSKEFAELHHDEIRKVESRFQEIFSLSGIQSSSE